MSISIFTNLAAQNAHRYLEANNAAMNQSIARLSSGLQINSAADNAAGFVISNHLGNQIAGLSQATQNTTGAVNILKTTQSALTEVQTQLQNIRDLVLDAANSNGNTEQKAADQSQIDQALGSINRIADQTNFDGMSLLGGTSGTATVDGMFFQIGANAGQQATFSLQGKTFGTNSAGNAQTLTANMHTTSLGFNTGSGATYAQAVSGQNATGLTNGATENFQIDWTHPDGTTTSQVLNITNNDINGDGSAMAANQEAAAINTALAGAAYTTSNDATVQHLSDVLQATVSNGKMAIGLKNVTGNTGEATNASTLKVKSGSGDGTGANFGLGGVSASGSLASSGINVMSATTKANFDTIIHSIDDAMNMVNGLQANLGAFQTNNLQSDLNSLSVANQNEASSQSSIQDTDMASEMVKFTKSQILSQAAQAMMTQANTSSQNIIAMLRGQA